MLARSLLLLQARYLYVMRSLRTNYQVLWSLIQTFSYFQQQVARKSNCLFDPYGLPFGYFKRRSCTPLSLCQRVWHCWAIRPVLAHLWWQSNLHDVCLLMRDVTENRDWGGRRRWRRNSAKPPSLPRSSILIRRFAASRTTRCPTTTPTSRTRSLIQNYPDGVDWPSHTRFGDQAIMQATIKFKTTFIESARRDCLKDYRILPI